MTELKLHVERKDRNRRRGELYGRFCWNKWLSLIVELIIFLAIAGTTFYAGILYQKAKDTVLKEVPVSEYVKGKVRK